MEDEEEEEDEIDRIQPITRRKDQPGNLTQSKHKPNTPFFRILSYYVPKALFFHTDVVKEKKLF